MSDIATDDDRDVVVVLHPDQPRVLTGGAGEGQTADVVGDGGPQGWAPLLAAARRVAPDGSWPLGPHLRVAGFRVHVVQARGPSVARGCRWSDRADRSWPEQLRRAVDTVLDQDAGRAPTEPLRPAWMRRSWWPEATAWVDARLAEGGRGRTGDLEPEEHWGVSAVARVPTTGGVLWLKEVPAIFRREPAVLSVLGERLPGRVPEVLVADEGPDGARYLLVDAGTVPDEVDEGEPARLAELIADLQVRTLDLLPRLRAAGSADRSPARLASGLARLTEDGVELDLLEPAERAALGRLLPQLTEQLLALDDGPLPAALAHGDFHPWNVVRPAGWSMPDAVVIDWTDSAIGPAGVDLATLAPRSPHGGARAPRAGEREPLDHAYASVWAAHLGTPLHEVEAAVAATGTAAHVFQALSYDEILRSVEPVSRWHVSGAMVRHLRALLDTAPAD